MDTVTYLFTTSCSVLNSNTLVINQDVKQFTVHSRLLHSFVYTEAQALLTAQIKKKMLNAIQLPA